MPAGLEVKDVLELLLQWGTAVNRQVDTATLSQTERMVALDLAQLGLFQPFQTGAFWGVDEECAWRCCVIGGVAILV